MKASRISLLVLAGSLSAALVVVAQGPVTGGSETVARPKKGNTTGNSGGSTAAPAEAPGQSKIPSQFKKGKDLPEGVATYSTDAVTVTVEVSVLDNKGHFIPNIPSDKFRVLEDNIPRRSPRFPRAKLP